MKYPLTVAKYPTSGICLVRWEAYAGVGRAVFVPFFGRVKLVQLDPGNFCVQIMPFSFMEIVAVIAE